MGDPEIYRYEESGPYPDVASLRERYERTSRGPGVATDRWWNYAVIVRDGERAIGTVELTLTKRGAHVEIGYSFSPAYWGFGYAFEATSAAIDDAIAVARPQAIDAYVDARNVRSYVLLERLGFRRLGLLLARSLSGGLPADDYHYRRACGDRSATP